MVIALYGAYPGTEADKKNQLGKNRVCLLNKIKVLKNYWHSENNQLKNQMNVNYKVEK